MEQLIVARHGESAYSAVGRVNGDPDVPVELTELGRREARALGLALADQAIDLCVTSEFPRTRQTADVVLEGRDVPRLLLPELNDVQVGDLEGGWLEGFRAWLRDAGPFTPPPGGTESRVDCVRRYASALRFLLVRTEPSILAISHGLFVTYAVRASRGEALPLTLEGTQAGHADPHRLSAQEVRFAAARLDAYVLDPSG